MRTYRDFIKIKTDRTQEVKDVTAEVSQLIARSGIQDGMVLLFPHTTSATVYLSDSDVGLTDDFLSLMAGLIPDGDYRHDRTDVRKNARAHLMSLLSGHHLTLPITEASLDLGVYQRIYYAEFDGGREKEILVKVIGD
jgi:secondary thiamine-phosphate synthase enzyme